MNAQANQMCQGVLLGLYKFEHESTSEFKNWASDSPGAFAWVVVDACKSGTSGRADVVEVKTFIEQKLGGWGSHLV